MSRKFEAVAFDWYATLGAPSKTDWWQTTIAAIADEGIELSEEAFATFATPPIDHLHASIDEATYRAYEEEQLRELLRTCGFSNERQQVLAIELIEVRDREVVGVFPEVVDFLQEIRSSDRKVALCSNWSWDLDRHLSEAGVIDLFDVVVCSASVGYRKPHQAIFEELVRQLDLKPETVAFVGDDWSADVEGASAAGLVPFHLARIACSVERHDDFPCVTSLEELRPLVLDD